MTSFSHPFMKYSEENKIPDDKVKDVDEVYAWIQEQPLFPNYTNDHAHLFLHACNWNIINTKKALQKYCKIRAGSPDLFDKRDPTSISVQTIFNLIEMVSLPIKSPEGYQILIYRLSDTDLSKLIFADAIKAFCMYNDARISEDGLMKGYIIIFDMKGLRFSHLAKIQLTALRAFMSYIQEAHPARLMKIYVVHTASFINQIMTLLKPFIKSELLTLLHFISEGPLDIYSKELLPEDYGGCLEPMAKLYKEQRHLVETTYRDWLIDSAALKEKPKFNSNVNCTGKTEEPQPIVNSLSAFEID